MAGGHRSDEHDGEVAAFAKIPQRQAICVHLHAFPGDVPLRVFCGDLCDDLPDVGDLLPHAAGHGL